MLSVWTRLKFCPLVSSYRQELSSEPRIDSLNMDEPKFLPCGTGLIFNCLILDTQFKFSSNTATVFKSVQNNA